jgi:neutral ceramidase
MRTNQSILLSILFSFLFSNYAFASYQVGTGKSDITGPVADVGTMGYASPLPVASGLHQRLWSRAFIIADEDSRVVHVTTDECFIPQSITLAVSDKLEAKYGDLYSIRNIMLTATHTHSAPGGLSHYKFTNIPLKGTYPQNFEAVVEGIFQSIVMAHENLQPGVVKVAQGELIGASVNRSRAAYLENPQAERDSYSQDTDPTMTVLRFEQNGTPIGMLNFFAVHNTSMDKRNTLISGDNKGYAAQLFENQMNKLHGKSSNFIAAFANANGGDASPNIAKDVDGDGDWECAANENFACASLSANQQLSKALELYNSASEVVSGPITFRHAFHDYSKVTIRPEFNGTNSDKRTCFGAIGFAMLAGSEEDGPGVGKEGNSCSHPNSFLARIRCLSAKFTCHGEKPVALPVGKGTPPKMPQIIPNQIFVIGQVSLIGLPAEFTTMSGRRLRNTVGSRLAAAGVKFPVISGYANAFTQYVVTREEYQIQHYEGGATHYNEWTLSAYQQNYAELADAIVAGTPVSDSAEVRRNMAGVVGPASVYNRDDGRYRGQEFGSVISDVKRSITAGEPVKVTFQGTNPNNNLNHGSSYFEIQRKDGNDWTTVANDNDWNTKMHWRLEKRNISLLTVEWISSNETKSGEYRIILKGHSKLNGTITEYSGNSATFLVN